MSTAPTGSTWNPTQYHRFANERRQPFDDLLAMCRPIPGGRAIDLGCGPGELTKDLHEKVGAATTIGLDNSETMLAKAEQHAGNGLTFEFGSIAEFAPETKFDLVFANASLQWVPGHDALLDRLTAGLADGGQLAVQVPANHDYISHATADAVAAEEPFATELKGYVRRVPVEPIEWYAEKLYRLGFKEQRVLMNVYVHYLASRNETIEWVKGTYLTDYQARLSPETFQAYLDRYREVLIPQLEDTSPYFYPFKRILFWAQR
jgi:trans-aconitate 2-methyltransferase